MTGDSPMRKETAIQKWPRIKQNLTPEMMFAIRLQTGLLLFLMGVLIISGFQLGWGWYGVILAAFVGWLNGTYWAVYIKRGIDRRFQQEELTRQHAAAKAREEAFETPPGRLLGHDRAPTRIQAAPQAIEGGTWGRGTGQNH